MRTRFRDRMRRKNACVAKPGAARAAPAARAARRGTSRRRATCPRGVATGVEVRSARRAPLARAARSRRPRAAARERPAAASRPVAVPLRVPYAAADQPRPPPRHRAARSPARRRRGTARAPPDPAHEHGLSAAHAAPSRGRARLPGRRGALATSAVSPRDVEPVDHAGRRHAIAASRAAPPPAGSRTRPCWPRSARAGARPGSAQRDAVRASPSRSRRARTAARPRREHGLGPAVCDTAVTPPAAEAADLGPRVEARAVDVAVAAAVAQRRARLAPRRAAPSAAPASTGPRRSSGRRSRSPGSVEERAGSRPAGGWRGSAGRRSRPASRARPTGRRRRRPSRRAPRRAELLERGDVRAVRHLVGERTWPAPMAGDVHDVDARHPAARDLRLAPRRLHRLRPVTLEARQRVGPRAR